ncbi:MAG TPA: GTP-binding protein [Spirochaetota bacterium]|nr:GTP-binding protein [Spirochaetota bacterium]
MKLIIVGGPASSGKTSVIIHALNNPIIDKSKVLVAKLDCLVANDSEVYKKNKIASITGLSTYICPDHYLSTNIERISKYGIKKRVDYLIIESAGLCNRCSPYLTDTLGVTILDVLSGIQSPNKIGPMLKSADIVVLTHCDMISQAEREVFRKRISVLNCSAKILEVNGLTGKNSYRLSGEFALAKEFDASVPQHLKYSMPGAVCSFCLGEKRVGETFASGNVKLMELPGIKDGVWKK